MTPGEWVQATVFGTPPFGVYLRHATGALILVHLSEAPWCEELSPRDVARVGDVLWVKVLRVHDGDAAGWLPWPPGHPRRGETELPPG